MSSPDAPGDRGPGGNMGGGGNRDPRTRPDKPIGRPGGKPPGGGQGGGPKDPCRPADYVYDPVTGSMVPPPGCPGAPGATPDPTPPPIDYDIIYDSGVGAVMPDVKTGIIADQYAKLLDVPYRQAFMPGGPEDSIFAAENVMPIETKADPRPYSKTNQIPIRDLLKLSMRDATDAELLGIETGPDKPLMSKDPYKMMSYQLDYMAAKNPKKKPPVGGGPGVGKPNPVPFPIPPNIMPPYPGPITPRPGGPIIPLPIVGPGPITGGPVKKPPVTPRPGGVFTPSPGGGGGGTYTGPGVNLPGPVIPLPGIGGPPKTGGNLIPLSNELGFTIDNEGNKIYSDAEGNPVFAADGGRIDKMDGGMMIIEDGVANDGIGSILKKYKEIRSEL